MNPASTPPDQPVDSSMHDIPLWKWRLATLWVVAVSLAYVGTVLRERGDRITRIVESITSRLAN